MTHPQDTCEPRLDSGSTLTRPLVRLGTTWSTLEFRNVGDLRTKKNLLTSKDVHWSSDLPVSLDAMFQTTERVLLSGARPPVSGVHVRQSRDPSGDTSQDVGSWEESPRWYRGNGSLRGTRVLESPRVTLWVLTSSEAHGTKPFVGADQEVPEVVSMNRRGPTHGPMETL